MEKFHISSFFFPDFRVSYTVMDSMNPILRMEKHQNNKKEM